MLDSCKKYLSIRQIAIALAAVPALAATSSIALTVSPNAAVFGAATTLTANVSPSSATGSVTFYDGGNFLGSAPLNNATASFNTKFLPAGPHSLRAYYPGNGSLTASTSASVPVSVHPLPINGVTGPVVLNGAPSTTPSFGAAAAMADFNGDGITDIVVTSDSGVNLLLGTAGGSFTAPVYIPTSVGMAWGVVALDFNGDGKTDLAIAGTQSTTATVSIWLGNGDGTFRAGNAYSLDVGSLYGGGALVAADFNNDGNVDLAALGTGSSSLSFLAGQGDGTFAQQVRQSYVTSLTSAVVTDVNGDGIADIVGANGIDVGIYIGKGDGTFKVSNLGINFVPSTSAVVGDFDGDGKLDLAATGNIGVVVARGNGDGTFQTPVKIAQFGVGTLTTGDFNDDGKIDLITPNGVFYGKGDGTFQIVTSYGTTFLSAIVLPGDFNGDGRTDLAFFGTDSSANGAARVALYYGIAVGTNSSLILLNASPNSSSFGQSVTLSATVSPTTATGKVTFYDGTIALGSATLSKGLAQLQTMVLNAGIHSLTARYLGDSTYGVSVSPGIPQLTRAAASSKLLVAGTLSVSASGFLGIALGDFNNDGKLDLVSNGSGTNPAHYFTGLGNGAFQEVFNVGGAFGTAPSVADFDLDGKLDFVILVQNGISIYFGKGDGTFASPVFVAIQKANRVAVADLNGDGRPDLIVNTDFGDLLTVMNNGNGTFQPGVIVGQSRSGLLLGDFNRDGYADFIVAGNLFTGTGTGAFTSRDAPTQFALAVGDLNQDGKADLVASNIDGTLTVYLGNGDGTFTTGVTVPVLGTYLGGLAIGDVDGDGQLDVVAGHDNLPNLYLLKGNGDGTLQAPVAIGIGGAGTFLAFADLNGDGRTDLISVNSVTGRATVLLGAPTSASASTTSLTGPALVFAGQAATLTATIAPATATGTVTFYDLGRNLGTASVAAGIATLSTASLTTIGSRSLIASYSGDGLTVSSFSATLPIQVNAGNPPVLAPATLPVGIVGQSYVYTFPVSGGTPPYSFGASNNLPGLPSVGGGLSVFAQSGQLKGTPAAAGTFNLTLTVTDHAGLQATQNYQVIVQTPVPQNYVGNVDSATCTAITGWIADKNRLNTYLAVSLWLGNTFVAAADAGNIRSDISTILGDNGQHGFSFPIPSSYANGVRTTYQVRYEFTATQVPGVPVTLTCGGSGGGANYVGYVDTASCSAIAGWAADTNRLNTPIAVSLWDGSTQIASVTANGSRSDVGALLGDNGLHAFSIPLPSGYSNGIAHTLQIRYETSTTQLPGSPATLTCGNAGPNYAGYVDSASCSGISGWAADKNRLNTPITISLWDGSTQIASTTANASRGDVGGILGDNGLHGFSIPLPAGYVNGAAHSLQIRYEISSAQLPGSPATLTCGANYAGYVDSATCSGVSGWAADKNRLNTPIIVSLWNGSTQIASTTANASRGDVGSLLGDNGLHGFSIPLPSGYSNGVAHSLQIRYESSTVQLPGSPAGLTCGGVTNYAGYVDSATCSGINGWAADKNRLNTPIVVTLWDGATEIASSTANSSRGDVGGFLGDNGLHGFSIPIPSGYSNGVGHTLQIRYETSTTQLPGSPASLTCGNSGGTANYTGYTDSASCSGINGWAADKNRLNTPIVVSLWDGGTQIASTTANASRGDVGAVLGDNGLHGFSIPIQAGYTNGVAHTLQIRYEASAAQLPGSPVVLTCGTAGGANYIGYVDTASCTGISGWSADKNRLNTPITVSLWDAASQIASTAANAPRSDVGSFLGDNGLHGYLLQLPQNYLNGASHALQVRFETSATQLAGSPITLTCSSSVAP